MTGDLLLADGTFTDQAGNPISITLPTTPNALEDDKTYIVAVPFSEDVPLEIATGNTVATVTAFQTIGILPGDHLSLRTVTEPAALDLSGDDCTALAPCVITGTDETWTGDVTYGDYWETYFVEHASDIILALGNTHAYSLIPTGSTLQIPEGATGVSVINDTIGGQLVVSETCATLKNLIVVDVTLAGLGAGETATFANSVFVQSKAAIEATSGGGTFTCGDPDTCLYGQTTASLFTDYAGGDYSLKRGSPAVNFGVNPCTGVDTPFTGCTGAGTGTWVDSLGNTVPRGTNADLGLYEFYGRFLRGPGRMGMGMQMH
jgi:hypothetical protein